MLKIVTDGAVDMPETWAAEYQINILPLRVNFGNTTFVQGINFKLDDFYRLVQQTRVIPKTTLPSTGQISDFYHSIAEKGDSILSIHVTSKLSGTFSAFQTAAADLSDDFHIFLVDSGSGSAAMGYMCREARILDRAGLPPEQIVQHIEAIREHLTVIFTLENLEFAMLSGRINALQNAISSMLKVNPIIELHNGLLDMGNKVRTRHRALEKILKMVTEKIGDQKANIAIVHASDPATAQDLYERIQRVLKINEIVITDLAIPVAANLGPGTIGIVAYPVEEE
jgi:DegV family protein with EDD domain